MIGHQKKTQNTTLCFCSLSRCFLVALVSGAFWGDFWKCLWRWVGVALFSQRIFVFLECSVQSICFPIVKFEKFLLNNLWLKTGKHEFERLKSLSCIAGNSAYKSGRDLIQWGPAEPKSGPDLYALLPAMQASTECFMRVVQTRCTIQIMLSGDQS